MVFKCFPLLKNKILRTLLRRQKDPDLFGQSQIIFYLNDSKDLN